MAVDLWPARATFAPGEPVRLVAETDAPVTATVEVTRVGAPAWYSTVELAAGESVVELGVFATGGYAVTVDVPGAATAFDVLASPLERPRYGFLSEFAPERADDGQAVRGILQLHQNAVQFYDWMYRHANLVGSETEFTDACGRRLSHNTTRDLVAAVRAAGALPMGYAAVYGVGKEYAAEHPGQMLYHADGTPRMLADLLHIANLDPACPWHDHIIAEFRDAVERIGFAGLHLDTYGTPKIAWNAGGEPVDLAEQFPPFLRAVRAALPESALIFNNVNDYPTFATGSTPQDACYIEVWDPHRDYGHFAALIQRARAVAPGKPVILAAYLTPFAADDVASAEWAARLALAAVFAHGGHYLLCGEGQGVLVHPYYPNFTRVADRTHRLLRRYFDFAVAQGDLLYDPDAEVVTHSYLASKENDELQILADAPVSADPAPGHLWVIARRAPDGLTVHLIDLTGQSDVDWNSGKRPAPDRSGTRVRVRWPGTGALVGSPENGPDLRAADTARDGDYLDVTVPEFRAWTVIHLPSTGQVPTRRG